MSSTKTYFRLSLASVIILVLGFLHIASGTSESTIVPQDQDLDTANTANMFALIYKYHFWGNTITSTPFFSGPGSHDVQVVESYVSATRSFVLNTFSKPPNAVDLGCGDFNVGRQIRNVTDRYIACDIVPGIIDYNHRNYAAEDVDFRVLDLISDDLPAGDIVFVRQVLQHLRNDQISRFLPKLRYYKWAIISEHIPLEDPFVSNLDIETGRVRLAVDSGVDLTEEPFSIFHYNATILCESIEQNARIRTTAYQLQETED